MPIIRVKDKAGNIFDIPAIIGPTGKGDMEASIYDPQGIKQDIFQFVNTKANNLEFDAETNLLWLTADGERIGDGVKVATTGGGAGGETNNATLSLKNTTGWMYKSIAHGASCDISFTWSSIEEGMATGNGVLKIYVNGTVKLTRQIAQGDHTIDVGELLSAGTCTVKVNVTDTYGNSRSINFNITAVALELTSTFDATVAYEGAIMFPYTPTAAATKTMHFAVDGTEIDTATVIASGRQQTFVIPAQTHGMHIFECWYTATVDGEPVESDKLRYALICIEEGNTTPIIASAWDKEEVEQYDTLNIPYIVYDPVSLTAKVTLSDGSKSQELTVDRTQQTWSYRVEHAGDFTLTLTSGTRVLQLSMTATESSLDVEAEKNSLVLHLSSYGRSNAEDKPSEWKYENIAASLTGFNYTSDGWVLDDKGVTVLRVAGDARVDIPLKVFANDFRTSGKTIELEFATRNVLNYDAEVISCWSGDRGIKITAQKALLKSEQSEISTQYKEDEKVRLAFVVEKRAEHRLLCIYINGIMSGVVQYPDDDDFSQTNPVTLTIGSNECTTDIYSIRVYDNNLTRYQIVDNWISDMQVLTERAEAYRDNDIFDDYGNIVIDKLPSDLPYLVLEGAALPTYKGNKLTVSGRYVDPVNASKSFTFTNAEIDVQGTSSAGYERKNYKIKFKNGITQNGTAKTAYLLGENNIETDTFTFKADVASSEGANNVELAKLYNDISPYRIPPQETDARVRQGIDGYPCVIFHDAGNGAVFIGKYNFNHDKGTPEVFGFNADDESWEIKNNTSNRVLWKNADYSGTDWKNDFEARHPEDNTNIENLKALAEWLVSTDRAAVTSASAKAARLQKFKDEMENYLDKESTLFYYLFTELFLLADSRAKNAFPTRYDNGKWCWLPYDMDTAIGINNEGKLAFDYYLEDTDLVNGAQVYNGQESVLWNNVRDAFPDEIMAMYQKLRSDGVLSYDITEGRFKVHQAKWSASIFNEDAYYKYLAPLFEKNNGSYLGMLQGSKEAQRQWWLYNRFKYIDSKYNAGDALTDFITLRGYSKGNIVVTPYADIYATVKYGSYLVQERALRGDSYTLECPVDDLDDTEIYIYSASQIADLGDLSALQVGYAEFAAGTKLNRLKLGDASGSYVNQNLTQLYAGNNALLKVLDVRNCPNLGNTAADVNATPAIDLSGCTNIEEVYFDNTAITSVTLPNGGMLKKLHLPATVTNLTLRNQTALTEFVMPSYANVSTLRLENVSSAVPVWNILNSIADNSRVRMIGFDWNMTADEIMSFYDNLDRMRGLDENGNNVDNAQLQGVIHTGGVTASQLNSMQTRYPSITIDYEYVTTSISFYTEDGSTLILKDYVSNGGNYTYTGATPTKADTAQYDYTFAGWSLTPNGAAVSGVLSNIKTDLVLYAAFTATLQRYTVTWKHGSTVLEIDTNVPYGTTPTYNGTEPSGDDGQVFVGWNPAVVAVGGNATYTAMLGYPYEEAEIVDSWDTIINNVISNRHTAKYKVGHYKPLDLGAEGVINMQIATLDYDTMADGSGMAPITFIARELLATSHRMNPSYSAGKLGTGNLGGWESSEMRSYLGNTIKPLIPANVRSRLVTLTREQSAADVNGTHYWQTTADDVWIPSDEEAQNDGVYRRLFYDATMRIKHKAGEDIAVFWWTRTGYDNLSIQRSFIAYSTTGHTNSKNEEETYGVALSFAIGPSEIADDWDTIIASIDEGTYKTKYKIGDYKPINLGTYGTIHMQIAAFGTDDLAGGGKAAITWVAKELLDTELTNRSHPVWSTNADRTYLAETILPLIPANIANRIEEVSKKHMRQHSNGSTTTGVYEIETTTDKLWIPSVAEVGIGLQSSGWSTYYSSIGSPYALFASENCSRVRKRNGAAHAYSLRDAAAYWIEDSVKIAEDGDWTSNSGEVSMLIGFCTGKA